MRTLLTLVLLACAAPAFAQTGPCPNVPDTQLTIIQPGQPTRLCFTKSVDHDALGIDGQPRIRSYEAQWFLDGVDITNPAVQPVQVADLGKGTPTPAEGAIWNVLPAYPIGNRYRIVTVAKGLIPGTGTPVVSARSAATNPFGVPTTTPPSATGRPAVP